jgi:zinc protease
MTRAARLGLGVLIAASIAAPPPVSAQVRNWPSESAPRPLGARPVKFPPYQVRTMANGLQVVVVEQHEQPAISVRMVIGAGSAEDVPPKLGVANLAASLLDQGTVTRSAQQIADTVDTMGGSVAVGAGSDLTFAYVTVLKDSFAQGLDVLSDIVRAPAFAQDELDRQRERLRSALRVDYQDPDYLATIAFERLVYGFHPYGFPGSGTPASIDRITRADLLEFHHRYFVPNNCLLAVVGDAQPEEAFTAVERTFGAWERREVQYFPMVDPPAPTRRVVVIDVPDAVQTEIRVGHLGPRRKSSDYTALDLGVRVLGGEGANRLQQVLRTDRGLTYGASADLESYRVAGDIVAETDTRSETTVAALRIMVDQFRRLQRNSVGERELEGAKDFLSGSFPLSIETPDAIATKVLSALFYGLPLKDLDTFRERVNAVSVDDIERVTRAYLKPDRLSIVLVGDASAFLENLSSAGLGKPEVIPLADLDVTTADLHRQPGAQPRPSRWPGLVLLPGTSKEGWERAKAVMARAAAAAGGLDALRAVRTIRSTGKTVMSTPDGPLSAATRTSIEYPERMRVDLTLPRGAVVQVYADGHAWLKDQTGPHDAPEPMRREFAQAIRRDWIALFLAAADDRVIGKKLADATGVGGRPLQVVELLNDGLLPVRVAVDGGTGRLAWLSYDSTGPGGRATVTENFDNFKEVGGIQIPCTVVVRRDSILMFERNVENIEVNVPIAPALFDKLQ